MDELGAKLAELADKLGVTVAELWPLMVQKVVLDWWIGTGIILVFWLGVLLFGRVVWKGYRDDKSWFWDHRFNDADPSGLAMVGSIVGAVCGAMLVILTVVQIATISTLFYPEIAAIQQISGLLK